MTLVKNPKDISCYGEIICIEQGCNNAGKATGKYILDQNGEKLRHRYKLCFTHNVKKDRRYDRHLENKKVLYENLSAEKYRILLDQKNAWNRNNPRRK